MPQESLRYEIVVRVPDMDCPHESNIISRRFETDERILSISYDHPTRLAVFIVETSVDDKALELEIPQIISSLGFPSSTVSIRKINSDTSNDRTVRIHVPDMCCPAESGMIERAFEGNDSVSDIRFDYASRTAEFILNDKSVDITPILATVRSLGMDCEPIEEDKSVDVTLEIENMNSESDCQEIVEILQTDAALDKEAKTITLALRQSAVPSLITKLNEKGWQASLRSTQKKAPAAKIPVARLSAAFVFAAAAEVLELTEIFDARIVTLCALIAIGLAGFDTILKGLKSLVHFIFNMSGLMAVAVIGACCLGAWPEAAMVMTLYEIGEAIEDGCMRRAKNAIHSLLDVSPKTVNVQCEDGSWRRMPVETVAAGTVYRIEPGERAGLDGTVMEGCGSMDESMMTGESLPVAKEPGSRIYAGALAIESALTIRATAQANDSMSARIIRSIEDAERKKAPLQRFVDRFAARYTPTVFAIALLTAIVGPFATDLPWTEWLYRALVILVISCPCALVISTPVTIVSALSLAAKRGILVKGGVYLEAGRLLKTVALDKTGTVTQGKPVFESLSVTAGNIPDRVFALGASLAAMSSHPISRAIAEELNRRKLASFLVKDFKALPGVGTQGRIEGSTYRLTNLRWLSEKGLATEEVCLAFSQAYDSGKSAVALSDMFGVLGVFVVSDALRSNAKEAIQTMKRTGLTPWLLTGDNARAAASIANQVGIEHVASDLLPEQKLEKIDRLDKEAPTAMAGDGINDAPALTRARIGFAMGVKGSDAAIEAADVALMDDNIGKIAWFKRLSELTHATLIQNIVFALTVKFGFALAAVCGHASMWAAVFADTGVCLIVVAWGMRLMKCARKVDRMTQG